MFNENLVNVSWSNDSNVLVEWNVESPMFMQDISLEVHAR